MLMAEHETISFLSKSEYLWGMVDPFDYLVSDSFYSSANYIQ